MKLSKWVFISKSARTIGLFTPNHLDYSPQCPEMTSNKMSWHRVSEQMVTGFCSSNELHETRLVSYSEIWPDSSDPCSRLCVPPSNCLFLKWDSFIIPFVGLYPAYKVWVHSRKMTWNLKMSTWKRTSFANHQFLGSSGSSSGSMLLFRECTSDTSTIAFERRSESQILDEWIIALEETFSAWRNTHPATWIAICWGRSTLGDRRLGEQSHMSTEFESSRWWCVVFLFIFYFMIGEYQVIPLLVKVILP